MFWSSRGVESWVTKGTMPCEPGHGGGHDIALLMDIVCRLAQYGATDSYPTTFLYSRHRSAATTGKWSDACVSTV